MRAQVLSHLRPLYVHNDHLSSDMSQSHKGLTVLEPVGGGEAARQGLGRVQRLLYHRHCQASHHLLQTALLLPSHHWLRLSAPHHLHQLDETMQMLLRIRHRIRIFNLKLRHLHNPESQRQNTREAAKATTFRKRVVPAMTAAVHYSRGVRGYSAGVEAARQVVDRDSLSPTTHACTKTSVSTRTDRGWSRSLSPIRAMAMLAKAKERER